MKIRMLRSQHGSPDGVSLLLYEDGKEYDLWRSERELDLARVFVREGWAAEVKDEPKDAGPAPEDKALPVPENKGMLRKRKG